jgi:diguanylate cyclase (GGDEF)-like protein/PAS domain S-box-containing protein
MGKKVHSQADDSIRKSILDSRLIFVEGPENYWEWLIPSGEIKISSQLIYLLDYSSENLQSISSQWLKFFKVTDYVNSYQNLVNYLLGRSEEFICEIRSRARNGDWKWLQFYAQEIEKDQTGMPIKVSGGFSDLTEQKNNEVKLLENESLQRNFADLEQFLLVRFDNQERLIFANEAYCNLFGKRSSELIGTRFTPRVHPVDQVKMDMVIDQVQNPPFRSVVEIRNETQMGWRWLIWETTAIKDDSGNTIEVQGIGRDITDRKRLEEELISSEKRYRELFSTSLDGVIFSSVDSTTLYANDAALSLLDLTKNEFEKCSLDQLFDHEDPNWEISRSEIANKNFFRGELTLLRKDGSKIPVEISTSLSRDLAGRIGMSMFFRDISERKRMIEELRVSNDNYQLIANNIDDVIWTFNAETFRFTYLSPSVVHLLDYTPEEVINMRMEDFLDQESLNLALTMLAEDVELLKKGEAIHSNILELNLMHKDGAIVPTETIATVKQKESGEFQVIGISRNITERKQAQKALLESEELFRKTFENATVGICLAEWDTTLVQVNDRLCEITGYRPEELLGKKIYDITYAEDIGNNKGQLEPLFAGKTNRVFYEKRYIHKDGHLVWVTVSAAIVQSVNGEVRYIIAHIQDISERKLNEDKLQQQIMAMEATPASIVITDPRGMIEYVNTRFCQITGYSIQEVIGRNPRILQSGQTPREVYKEMWATLRSGKEWHGEFVNQKKNGEQFIESASISPLTDSYGKITHFVAVKEDITEKKQAEKQLLVQRDLAQNLASSASLETALPICLQLAIEVSEMDCGGLFITDPVTGAMNLTTSWGLSADFIEATRKYQADSTRTRQVMKGEPIYANFNQPSPLITGLVEKENLKCMAVIPFKDQGKVIGAFHLASHSREDVPTEDRQTLEIIASQVGTVIARIQTQEAWRNSQQEWQTLFNSMQDFLFIVDSTGKILQTNQLVIDRLGYTSEELIGQNMTIVHPIEMREKATEVLAQVLTKQTDTSSLPLQTKGGKLIPVETRVTFGRWNNQPAFFGVTRDMTARDLAESKLHTANENLTERLEELRRRNFEIAQISEMSAMLQVSIKTEEAYQILRRHLQLIFPNLSGILFTTKPETNLLESHLHWGLDEFEEEVFPVEDCIALRRGRTQLSIAAKEDIFCPHISPHKPAASLCVPIIAQSDTLGMLQLIGLAEEFNPNRLALIQTVVDTIALSLVNIKLRETLQQQSIRDPLTNLFNRRFMEESLVREFARATRSKVPIGLIMFDIDHFKEFNDTYGHPAGDMVLFEVGKLLQKFFRKEDITCRYGGEEFLVIMPGASLENTLARADQLLHEISHLDINYRDKSLGSITISAGVALFPDHGNSTEEIIMAVDSALYSAKKSGRNRVCTAKTDSSSPE